MNIPRQFYGVNYLTKIVSNFQDTDLSECPQINYHEINDVKELPFEQRDSYALGLNAGLLSELFRKLVSNRLCALDGIAIAKGESLLFSGYRPPYTKTIPHITNSTCKTVVAIGIQFAISEGLLKEEDAVLKFFPEYESRLTPKFVRQITVKHLLTMTSGTKCNELTSMVEKNWVKAFLLSDCQFEPGSRFVYNSMNTYMLAAILTKVSGTSVMEYLRMRFFVPLGINHVKWELCPEGIERGGWGLHISLDGMLKIGIFLAQNGQFHGVQLIESSYIRKMKEENVFQDVDALATGYGYQLWHLPEGLFMLSGMYGQHIIVDEKHDMVVATNAHSNKMFPDSKLVRTIIKYLTNEELYRPQFKGKELFLYHKLMQEFDAFCNGWNLPNTFIPSCFLYKIKQNRRIQAEVEWTIRLFDSFDGKRLHIEQTSIKLFPYMLQGMYQWSPFNVTDIAVKRHKNSIKIWFFKEQSKKERREKKLQEHLIFEAGIAEYRYQTIRSGQLEKAVAVKASSAKDEDGHFVILLDIVFLAEGFSRMIKFFFLEERIAIECQESPDMRAIAEQVLCGDTVIAGNTIDLTDKLPEGIRVFLEHKVEPRVNASIRG